MRRCLFMSVALGVSLTGLAAVPVAAQSPAATGGTLAGTSWLLTAYLSGETVIDTEPGYIVDATFSDTTVAGFSGCNQYVAEVTVSGASITVGPIATTGRLCKMAIPIEQDYLAALATAATFSATDASLTLFDAAGATILTYDPAPANPLEGPWVVTGYNNGAEAVVSPVVGSTITVGFSSDGQVFGSTGCNSFSGPFEVQGDQIGVGQLGLTMMACDDALMTQESQFLTALQTPATIEVSGGIVTFRDANGAIQVTLARP